MPFFMVYRAEVVLPPDIEYDSPRIREYDEDTVEEARQDDVDAKVEAR